MIDAKAKMGRTDPRLGSKNLRGQGPLVEAGQETWGVSAPKKAPGDEDRGVLLPRTD